ncbi:MAG: YihY/virulence factor BrkB family protein [Marinifilaceae bacterium]
MEIQLKKTLLRFFSLDFYFSVLRRDWRISTFITDVLLKGLAFVVVTTYRFVKDACVMSASALTFYSSLAIIPLCALLLAIARGFGVSKIIEEAIRKQQFADSQITEFLIDFANNALEFTRGGLVTGIGIILLMWAVIRAFSSTELAMNQIWRISRGRTISRKMTQYMSIMFIATLLIIIICTINVFLTTNLQSYLGDHKILNLAGEALIRLLNMLPYLLVWVLFIFIYMFMPTTAVRFKHAFWAGVIAGTAFQLIQWVYIRFQIGVSNYNAIYGSLAALPLLLVWIQISWCVVLWGAELCYIMRNRHVMFKNEDDPDISWTESVTMAIRIIEAISTEFKAGNPPPTLTELSKRLKINTGKLRIVLQLLINKGILIGVKLSYDVQYYPALDLHNVSTANLIIKLSELDKDSTQMWKLRAKDAIIREFKKDTFLKDSN